MHGCEGSGSPPLPPLRASRSPPRAQAHRAIATSFAISSPTTRTIVPAERADPLLVNPWGLAASATSPWWPVNQGSNTSTITPATNIPNATLARVPGGPTGGVAGAGGTQLLDPRPAGRVVELHLQHAGRRDPRLARRHPEQRRAARDLARDVGAVYMGLAIATGRRRARGSTRPTSRNNRIDMVNAQWQLIDAPGAFVDPNLPAGYGAYGIQTVGNRIIVTYAAPGPRAGDPRDPGRRPRRRQRVRPQRQLPRARREPGRRPERPVGHRAGAPELRRVRRRPADRQLRRRPHQRVPRERQRHVDAERHAAGARRPAAVHRRPVGAPVRQGRRRQRRRQPPVLHRRAERRDRGPVRPHHPEPDRRGRHGPGDARR